MTTNELQEKKDLELAIHWMRIGLIVILGAFMLAKFTMWMDVAEARTLTIIMSTVSLAASFSPHIRRNPRTGKVALVVLALTSAVGIAVFMAKAL